MLEIDLCQGFVEMLNHRSVWRLTIYFTFPNLPKEPRTSQNSNFSSFHDEELQMVSTFSTRIFQLEILHYISRSSV